MNAKNRLFTYLKAKRGQLMLALLFALLFVIAQIAQPFLLGKALDASSPEVNNQGLFYAYIFVALALVLIGVVFGYLFEVVVMDVAQKVIKSRSTGTAATAVRRSPPVTRNVSAPRNVMSTPARRRNPSSRSTWSSSSPSGLWWPWPLW